MPDVREGSHLRHLVLTAPFSPTRKPGSAGGESTGVIRGAHGRHNRESCNGQRLTFFVTGSGTVASRVGRVPTRWLCRRQAHQRRCSSRCAYVGAAVEDAGLEVFEERSDASNTLLKARRSAPLRNCLGSLPRTKAQEDVRLLMMLKQRGPAAARYRRGRPLGQVAPRRHKLFFPFWQDRPTSPRCTAGS